MKRLLPNVLSALVMVLLILPLPTFLYTYYLHLKSNNTKNNIASAIFTILRNDDDSALAAFYDIYVITYILYYMRV